MKHLMRPFRGGSSLAWPARTQHRLIARAGKAKSTKKIPIESEIAPISEGEVGEIEAIEAETPVKKTRKPRKAKANSDEAVAAEDISPSASLPDDITHPAKKATKKAATRTMSIKTPWGVEKDAEEQLAELELYESNRPKTTEERRVRKKKAPLTPAAAEAIEINSEMEAKLVIRDEGGNPTVDLTALGEGKMATWAVGCFVGKEKKYIEALEGFIRTAAPLVDKETGQVIPRVVDFSFPTKKIRTFNEKNIKWADKTIKYKDGGWVFVQGILDKELYGILSSTLYFQYFRNTLRVKFPFEDDAVEVPVPCTEAELEEVEAWKLHKNEEAAEMEKCQEYGGPVDVEIANQVIRRDEMEEDIDYDESGNKVYKNDYRGSFANPNNFYEPDTASDFSPEDPRSKAKGKKKAASVKEERPVAAEKKAVSKKSSVQKEDRSQEDDGWYAPPIPPPSTKSKGKVNDDDDEALFGDWANDDLFRGLDDDLFSSVGKKGFQEDFDLGLGDGFGDFFDDEDDPFGLGRFDDLPSTNQKGGGQGRIKSKDKQPFEAKDERMQSWMQTNKSDRNKAPDFQDEWDIEELSFVDGPEDDLFASEGPGWGSDMDPDFGGKSRARPPPNEGRRGGYGSGSSPPQQQRDGGGVQRGYQEGRGGGRGGRWSGQQDRDRDRGGSRQDYRDRDYGRPYAPRYEDRPPSRERQGSGGYQSQGQGYQGRNQGPNPNYQGGRGDSYRAPPPGAGQGSMGRGGGQYDRPSSFDRFTAEDDMGDFIQKSPRKGDREGEGGGEEAEGFEEREDYFPSDRGGGEGGRGRGGYGGGRGYEGGRGRGEGRGGGGGRGRW